MKLADTHSLSIAVKAGGHNIAGKALADGGLVIDFARMKRVAVDPKARIARVQPGATLGDVDRVTQSHGLAVPSGVNSTTGIAGLTLGGGFGWTTRKYGLTIDNLRSVRLVTAEGRVRTIDENSDPDWRQEQDDERCIRWARELHWELEPHAMGSVYVNFIPEGDEDDIDAAYGAQLSRLRRVKATVDPNNLFRANVNIAPAR